MLDEPLPDCPLLDDQLPLDCPVLDCPLLDELLLPDWPLMPDCPLLDEPLPEAMAHILSASRSPRLEDELP